VARSVVVYLERIQMPTNRQRKKATIIVQEGNRRRHYLLHGLLQKNVWKGRAVLVVSIEW
jgi:hypothetical protein